MDKEFQGGRGVRGKELKGKRKAHVNWGKQNKFFEKSPGTPQPERKLSVRLELNGGGRIGPVKNLS